MFAALISFVAGLLGKFLGSLFGPKDPTPVQLAASNRGAQDEASQLETANALDTKADDARIAGDSAVVRVLADEKPGAVDAGANAAVAARLPDAFN